MPVAHPICKSICASTGKPCTHRAKQGKEYCGKHEYVEKCKAERKIRVEKEAKTAWIKYAKDLITWEDLPDDKKHDICKIDDGQIDVPGWRIQHRVEIMVGSIKREKEYKEREIQRKERARLLDEQQREMEKEAMERQREIGLLISSTRTTTKSHDESGWTKHRAGWSRDYRKIDTGPVDWWSIDRGIGYKLGGSSTTTKYMSDRDKQIAALLRRGIVCT